ncbi:MAG: glycosyltransferase, partial [Arenimonas sp.]
MTESRHSFQGKPIGAGRAQKASDVGVVVVSHQSAQTIRRCLKLLLASAPVVRIVVVDNASNDGTLALVERLASDERRITL